MHIVVAGAGIVGVASAIWLQRAGHRVTLVDRGRPGQGTSFGNAGVLAASSIIPVTVPGLLQRAPGMLFNPDKPLFLRWSYLPKLLPFLRRYLGFARMDHVRHYAFNMAHLLGDSVDQHSSLAAGTGAEAFIGRNDYCFGYDSEAAFQSDTWTWDLRCEAGYDFEVLSGDAFGQVDPLFEGAFARVVVNPNHGMIRDPGAYVAALAAHFEAEGGTIIEAVIEDVEGETLITSEGRIGADKVLLCLGPWSGDLSRKLGLKSLSFEAERGYHIELVNPSEAPKNPMMVAAGKFVITPMNGRIRAAGVVEFGGLDAGPSAAPVDLLKRQVAAILPGVTYDRIDTWMGHRPAPADSLPLLGEAASGTYVAYGHQHVGLTGGAKTGRVMAQMIDGQASNFDLGAFEPKRYK